MTQEFNRKPSDGKAQNEEGYGRHNLFGDWGEEPAKASPSPAASASVPAAPAGERLQNILAQRGIASRRHAAEMIQAGQVTVNGELVYEPGRRVNIATDTITVDGKELAKEVERRRTILMYKPVGLICSADSSRGKTVCDYLREQGVTERVVPVGRLDKESDGLLLMSNDGELTNLMTHPRYGHTKTYVVRVAGHYTDEKIDLLRSPLTIDGYQIEPVQIEVLHIGGDNTHRIAFTLAEGRHHQIRKMCSLAHFVVLSLTRVSIGPFKVGYMKPGEWRDLSAEEIAALKAPDPAARRGAPRRAPR